MGDLSDGVSVLIPVYNEQYGIQETVSKVMAVASGLLIPVEIVVVNDGSTDGTEGVLCEFGDELRLVSHDSNRGYGAALKTAIRSSRYSVLVMVDGDGTYPVERIPHLLNELKHASMVVGSRTGQQVKYPIVRMLPKMMMVLFAEWIVGTRIPDLNSGLRAFRKEDLVEVQRLLPDRFSFTTTLTVAMMSAGMTVLFIPINYQRRIGRSKFRPLRDTWNFAITLLRLGVYFAPLKVFMPVAALLGGLGFATLLNDVFVRQDLTERTLFLTLGSLNIGMLGLLCDLISRK